MTVLERSALLPYPAATMYDIVNRVEHYPEFLPWCGGSEILSETEDSMEASILIKKGRLQERFTTRNQMEKDRKINLELVNGPFRRLNGDWVFTDIGDAGSKIELRLEFEFSSGLIGQLVKPVFTHIANTLVDSFCERAHQLCRLQK